MLRIFVLALFAAGVPLGFGGAYYFFDQHLENRAEYTQLQERGLRVDATVVSRERVRDRSVTPTTRRRFLSNYFVTYRFDANGGTTQVISFNAALNNEDQDLDLRSDFHEFTESVGKAEYDAAGGARPQPVIFLPDDPSVVRLVDEDGDFARSPIVVLAILSLGLGVFSIVAFRQYKKTGRTF